MKPYLVHLRSMEINKPHCADISSSGFALCHHHHHANFVIDESKDT